MRNGSTHELPLQHHTCTCVVVLGFDSMTKIYGGRQRNSVWPSHFSRGSKSVACYILQALERLNMVEKDQEVGYKLPPQGQRDLDRIAGQVAAANKKH